MSARTAALFMTILAVWGASTEPMANAQVPILSGTVAARDTGEPIGGAEVEIRPSDDPDSPLGFVLSDSAGRFRLEGIPPGAYRVQARAVGFVRQKYGARYIGGLGTTIRLSAGEESHLGFSLTRAATISGRVLDTVGAPLPAVIVQAWRERYTEDGSRQLIRSQSAETDDRGEYRLFGLDPDAYLISVDVPGTPGQAGTRQGTYPNIAPSGLHAPVFHPGILDSNEAVRVRVGEGEFRGGVHIRMAPVRTASIRGRLTGLSPGARTSVGLTPASLAGPGTPRMVETDDDGAFVFSDVAPGSYILMGMLGAVSIPIEVFGEDIEVTDSVIGPSVTFSIHVTLDVPDPTVDLASFPVQLVGMSRGASSLGTPPVPDQNGVRTAAAVEPGRYRVDVRAYTAADAPYLDMYYVKQMTFGGMAVTDDVIEVGDPDTRLDIVLGTNGGSVAGTAINDDGPVFDARVVLAPEGRDHVIPRLFRSVTTDESGNFRIGAIAPGAYRLLAFESLDPYAHFHPDLRSLIESEGVSVEIGEGESARVNPEVTLADVQ